MDTTTEAGTHVVRPITDSERDLFRLSMARGFGSDPHDKDDPRRLYDLIELPRTVAAFDGGEMVGTCAAFTFDVSVPGGTVLPMGGTTVVTVQPTHRRRGYLRAMMREHLDEVRARGEPLAGLWASESSIYGRFGYGLAAECAATSIDGRTIEFRGDPPPGTVRLVEPDDARAIMPDVYERVRRTRPGMFSRSETWWKHRVLADPEHRRGDRSKKRFAVHTVDGEACGYATYRQKDLWPSEFPEGEVHVGEVVAATPEAHEALWRFLARIDLYPKVKYWNLPVDDQLGWRLTEPRRVVRNVWDSLWIRLIDVRRALTERAYANPGRLVLGVRDAFMPDNEGSYELEADRGGADCRRTTDPPDLELSVEHLGALYLGAHRASTLAGGGLIDGDAEALETADRLFAWTPLPWCPQVF